MKLWIKKSHFLAFLLFQVQVWAAIDVEKQFEETSYFLKDVCVFASDKVWTVGAPHWDQQSKQYIGTILFSGDSGKSWTPQPLSETETLRGIHFVSADSGWTAGDNGTVFSTTNGGNTWIKCTTGTTDDFRGLFFCDNQNGWAASVREVHTDPFGDVDDWRGSVWHTTNGGSAWTEQILPDSASLLNRIDFIDELEGWVVGIKFTGYQAGVFAEHRAAVYHTSDGGSIWEEQYAPDLDIVFTAVDFIDADHGWIAGFKGNSGVSGGTVFRTADGGESWTRLDPEDVFWDVQFLDSNRGYLTGCMYGSAWGPPVYRTTDGGDTWEKIAMEKHDGEGLYGIGIIGNSIIAVGDYSYVCLSSDPWGSYGWPHGENLFSQSYIEPHYQFEGVFFADTTHGWAVGKKTFDPAVWGQVIFNTSDGGNNWESQYEQIPPDDLPGYYRLDAVWFTDTLTGWAVGKSEEFNGQDLGAVLHTTDGGLTWNPQGGSLFSSWDLEFVDVFFFDSVKGWILAESNFPSDNVFLACTENGGADWDWVDTGINGSMCTGFEIVQGGISFADTLNGWITGGQGLAIHTSDGGSTWHQQTLPSQYTNCFKVHFITDQIGWIAGEEIYHTTNGGDNWYVKNTGFTGYSYDIQFVTAQKAWLTGAGGGILETRNGGAQWDPVNMQDIYSDLRSVHFPAENTGWAVGDEGTILKIHSKTETGIRDLPDNKSIPNSIVIFQNYPNPFNPSTTIHYYLLKSDHVTLKVFDILGREIETLVDCDQEAGDHQIRWNPEDLAGSIYLCRMTAGGHEKTIRLLLIK